MRLKTWNSEDVVTDKDHRRLLICGWTEEEVPADPG